MMKIRTNQSAAFALRYANNNRSAVTDALEKLSSGYAINSAADDASGLAISEKMRAQIRGLEAASVNSQDGVSLVQTGEGALEEIHGMLNRAVELAERSANGTYNDQLDREALQKELDQLCTEIDRIAENANFNGIRLFQDKGQAYETAKPTAAGSDGAEQSVTSAPFVVARQQTVDPQRQPADQPRLTLEELLEQKEPGELNIVYIEDPMSAVQQPGTAHAGASDSTWDIPVGDTKISDILKGQIVPQTVQNILKNYSAFSYLKDSAIGIGLRLYRDETSNVLASVALESSLYSDGTTQTANGSGTGYLGYTLSVNMGQVNTSDDKWRSELEATIAHEMMHAFMDEATTAGMIGKLPGSGGLQDVGRFDSWFIEGMAQTASGPNGWVKGGLGLTATSTDTQIKAAIAAHKLADSNPDLNNPQANPGDTYSQYGTGYLACMYLGAVAGGYQAGETVSATTILSGLNKLMTEVIGGSSLDKAINALTSFSSSADFKTKFDNGTAPELCDFVRGLITAWGSGRGGLASGNLADADLTDDASLSGVKLFALDTKNSMIKNIYPSGYVALTGGTTSVDGTKPVDFSTTPSPTPSVKKPFTVTGGVEGIDYDYESDGTTLVINTTKELTISGGNLPDDNGKAQMGRIKVRDGVGTVKLVLDGVDCSQNTVGSGLSLGKNNNVTLSLKENTTNTFKGGVNFAGVHVGTGTNLTIDKAPGGDPAAPVGKLIAHGGAGSAGIGASIDMTLKDAGSVNNSITINGGDIEAYAGGGAAGIGGGNNTAFGDITITGGTITTRGASSAAGIGGGGGGDNGKILITGCDSITTTSPAGVGIGSGQGAHSDDITITGGNIKATGGSSASGIGADLDGFVTNVFISGGTIEAIAGSQGAGIGTGPNGHVTGSIVISGEDTKITASGGQNGVAIGTGQDGSTCGSIHIKSGTITATGSTNSTGIGAGRGSSCDEIIFGDPDHPDHKLVVTAQGGMTNNGGNIMAFTDNTHTKPGTIKVLGNAVTLRPGSEGEGLYSTSGVVNGDGKPLYAYPLYLFEKDGTNKVLSAGVGLDANPTGTLPLDASKVKADSITISTGDGTTWTPGLSHDPLDEDYVFVWLRGRDQTLTVTYEEEVGGKLEKKTVQLKLKYYPDSGTFRIASQPKPDAAVPPSYSDGTGPTPPEPPEPEPPEPDPPTPIPEEELGGIILQIGAEYGETLTVPRFYLSLGALQMQGLDISTQANAWRSMPVIRNAINRVSEIRGTYGALYNRLEHNQNQLQHMVENITSAESHIRDADMAKEMMRYTKSNILLQSAQAMLAQAGQQPQGVLQLLR